MSEPVFNNRRSELLRSIEQGILEYIEQDSYISSLKRIRRILLHYTFENRLECKGILTRVTIDSLELPYELAEQIIQFDRYVT